MNAPIPAEEFEGVDDVAAPPAAPQAADDGDDRCTCQAPEWCGATRRDVVRELQRKQLLNAEQADAQFDAAQAVRAAEGRVLS